MTSTPSIFSSIKKLNTLLNQKERLQWLGIAGLAMATSLLEVLTAGMIVLFARVLAQPNSGLKYFKMLKLSTILSPGRVVFYIAISVGVGYLIKNCIAAAQVFYQNFSIQQMNYRFKNKLLQCYSQSNYEFYLARNSSLGMQVVDVDVERIFSKGMVALADILSEGMIFLCLVSLIIFMNPTLAIALFGMGAVLALIVTKGLLPRFYHFGHKLQSASLYSHQNLMQFFHAFKEILLLGKRETFVEAYKKHSHKQAQVMAIQMTLNALPRMLIEVLFVGLFVAAVIFLCLQRENPMQVIGVLGGYIYAGFRLMPGLNHIIHQLNVFKLTVPHIERVYSEYNTVSSTDGCHDIPNFTFQEAVIINNLSFRYLNTKKNALTEISFEIKKGECIGIVGETGSGKSTLVDIILGLLKPQEGTVLIDGRFPANTNQWHQKIGYVPQSVYLTDDTIEANIAFGEEEINEEALEQAVDAAQLRKFINQLPEATKTIVGERGIRLSGGERQRIAIARALYRNPEVLIFDEATSALDSATEEKLMTTIHAVSQNRTVIMIAHRVTTLKDCNRIIVMANGRVREQVKHIDQIYDAESESV